MKSKKTLGEITTYISKGVVPKYAKKGSSETIRVLNQRCNKNNKISLENSRLHDMTQRRVPDDKKLKINDVLINSTGIGTAGRVAQITEINEPMTVDGHMIILRPKDNINPTYYGYLVMANQYRIEQMAEGSTGQTEINRDRLLNEILCYVPTMGEQKRIGYQLQRLDLKINLNNQINDNLFALSKVIFDHILGNKTIKFSQISTIQNGYAFKSKEYITDKQLMILRTKNINDNHLFSKNDVIYISNNLFSNYKKFLFNTFDTVLVMVGASIGKTGFITSNMMPALQNQNMWRFRPLISGMPGLLVYQYVNYINEHVKGSATGSARSFYRKKVFNDFNVPYIEHKNYAIFIALQKEINRINVENDILRNIKKSLLNYFF